MATENLVIRDARLAHFHEFKILAQVLPRLPPELSFGAPASFILNFSHSSGYIVKRFDIENFTCYILILSKTPCNPSFWNLSDSPIFLLLRRIIGRRSICTLKIPDGMEPCCMTTVLSLLANFEGPGVPWKCPLTAPHSRLKGAVESS
jgi:hypothetical protein